MTWLRRQWLPLSLLVIAVEWVARVGWGPAVLGPANMIGRSVASGGPGHYLDDAQRAAARFDIDCIVRRR